MYENSGKSCGCRIYITFVSSVQKKIAADSTDSYKTLRHRVSY